MTNAQRHRWLSVALIGVGVALMVASVKEWLPMSQWEVVGAVTGAWCVALVVMRNIWNYPIGIISCAVYCYVFWDQKLYGDAGLQIVFIILAIHGFWAWRQSRGLEQPIDVRRIRLREGLILLTLLPIGTIALQQPLLAAGGSAPTLDAFTTTLSLLAQWMLNRKYLENWYVWIVADVIYVYLYTTRELYLTAVLYSLFLGMCIAGLIAWRRALAPARQRP